MNHFQTQAISACAFIVYVKNNDLVTALELRFFFLKDSETNPEMSSFQMSQVV